MRLRLRCYNILMKLEYLQNIISSYLDERSSMNSAWQDYLGLQISYQSFIRIQSTEISRLSTIVALINASCEGVFKYYVHSIHISKVVFWGKIMHICIKGSLFHRNRIVLKNTYLYLRIWILSLNTIFSASDWSESLWRCLRTSSILRLSPFLGSSSIFMSSPFLGPSSYLESSFLFLSFRFLRLSAVL